MPISVAYNQWTQFQDFSNFMKKVDGVNQEDEVKLNFKAQVFWSHRTWEATILEQVPDEKIVWRSKGAKGHVDGAVTFHELAPNLTRILVVLEYYPQGLFERTGNIWRAQGRRARLELKHFRRHVMTEVIQDPDSVEGWRGVIHDGEVERDHDEVVEEEQQQRDEDSYDGDEPEAADYDEGDEGDEEYDDEDSYDEEEPEEDSDEEEPEDEYDEDEPRVTRKSPRTRTSTTRKSPRTSTTRTSPRVTRKSPRTRTRSTTRGRAGGRVRRAEEEEKSLLPAAGDAPADAQPHRKERTT